MFWPKTETEINVRIKNINEPTEIIINGLKEGTKYFYRLIYRTPNTSVINYRPTYSFQTAKKQGVPFTFVVQQVPIYEYIIRLMCENNFYRAYEWCSRASMEDFESVYMMIVIGDMYYY